MRIASAIPALVVGVLAAAPAWGQGQTVVDLRPRPGVTLRYLAVAPQGPPKAAVLLFTGGNGIAAIPDRPGPTWSQNGNFLVRSRDLFRARGMFVAVVDAPSDNKTPPDGLGAFRIAADHAADIAKLIADVRKRAPGASVWLVGTSRGTISVANAGARLAGPDGPPGLVLTATITRAGAARRPGSGETVFDTNLAAIRVPVLLFSNREDACAQSPAADLPMVQRSLTGSPATRIATIDGGDPPRSDPCQPLSRHGFLGREEAAVGAIVTWLLDPQP